MKFGDILRSLINDRNITQKQLAADLNIAPSTLGNYIQDSREPDFQTLKSIAAYFSVTVDYLIDHPSPYTQGRKEEEEGGNETAKGIRGEEIRISLLPEGEEHRQVPQNCPLEKPGLPGDE